MEIWRSHRTQLHVTSSIRVGAHVWSSCISCTWQASLGGTHSPMIAGWFVFGVNAGGRELVGWDQNDLLFCERFLLESLTILLYPRIPIEIEKGPSTPYENENSCAERECPLPGISESIECIRSQVASVTFSRTMPLSNLHTIPYVSCEKFSLICCANKEHTIFNWKQGW